MIFHTSYAIGKKAEMAISFSKREVFYRSNEKSIVRPVMLSDYDKEKRKQSC